MQAVAKAKFLRGSARKMRLVADLVRGKQVDVAIATLMVLPKAAAVPVRKTVESATANALAAEGTARLKMGDLRISKITVDGGPVMKRIRPMAMGRAYRIRKQLCHLTVILEGEPHEAGAEATSAAGEGKKKASGAKGTAARKKATKKKAAGLKTTGKTATKKSASKKATGKKDK
jgi:large subunit ribosomal protein L22